MPNWRARLSFLAQRVPGRQIRSAHQAVGWPQAEFHRFPHRFVDLSPSCSARCSSKGVSALTYANIGRDGRYSAPGVAIGEAKVAVSSQNPKSSDFVAIQREGSKPRPPKPEILGWFPIPAKYDAPYKSGLVYVIKRGENTINIELGSVW